MEIIADLHLHSKYSRACSKDLSIENLEKYGKIKGINLMGTGDFQHPKWQQELKHNLTEDGTGILKTRTGYNFMLTSEISLMYSQGGKGRKIHNVVWAKSLEIAAQVSDTLLKRGRIDYDGRPIFGISCPEFVDLLKSVDETIEIIPAHIWTPWFGLFGSNSGFNSIKEAFADKANKIHAVETGLSSNPAMNWRVAELDDFSLVSFSDSHSYWPWRLGREATVFELKELSYHNLINSLKTGNGLKDTIEVDPGYGKYHYDGHRNCGISLPPSEAIILKNICPRCRKPLTIGVEHRVEELADRPVGTPKKDAKPYETLVPLSEIIASALSKPVASNSVWQEYYKVVGKIGSEFDILRKTEISTLKKYLEPKIVLFIQKVRDQKLNVIPGYDGVYGIPDFGQTIPSEPVSSRQKGLEEYY